VLLEEDTLWAGMGSWVHRFRVPDGALEASAELRSDVRALVRAGGVLLACAEASRSKYGELALLDPLTLAPLHRERLSYTFTRGVAQGGRVRLFAGYRWSVYDVAARAFVDEGVIESPSRSNVDRMHLSADEGLLVEIDSLQNADRDGWRGVFRSIDLRARRVIAEQETVEMRGAGDLDPTGARLATCHVDGRVRVWDAHTGALLGEIDHPASCTDVCWFPDGRALLGWNDAGALVELPAPRGG
jgi:hypothetical protein